MSALKEAQQARDEQELDRYLDQRLELIFSSQDVGPDARFKLRKLLKHYAKEDHPFRACTRDNMKRFGPRRTEQVCATLKDIIRGTTRWRHGHDGVSASGAPEIDDELHGLLMSLSPATIEQLELTFTEAPYASH